MASIGERKKLGERKKQDKMCQERGETERGRRKKGGQKKEKCQGGTEARGKKQPSRHGAVGKCVGKRIRGYLCVRREGS
jgi:hypothetical protein